MNKLYGVGVGPGDPELITVKALNALKEADIICCVGNKENSLAFNIAKGAWKDIDKKEIVGLDFPMTKDAKKLESAHVKIAALIKELLCKGNVALITLGDPGIYSTYSYILKILKAENIDIVTIPGVTSFSASAAKLLIPLTLSDEELHIIPSSYDFKDVFKLKGTLVFMKSGKNYQNLVLYLKENHFDKDIYMIENCGIENEKIHTGSENLPPESGYFTTVIIRGMK